MPLLCQSVLERFGITCLRIFRGMEISTLLEVKGGSLQRSLQANREACIVSGRCCMGNGCHTSRVRGSVGVWLGLKLVQCCSREYKGRG